MKITVIIPTRNRPVFLRRALLALSRQTLVQDLFEVIVVDNGSAGEAAEVTRDFHGILRNLRYRVESSPGLHNARHAGMWEGESNILAYIDDDSEAGPEWLAALVQAFDDPDVALVGGNNYPCFEVDPPEWLLLWWQRPVCNGRALGYLSILDFGEGTFEIDPAFIWGCNFAVRKKVLVNTGGFHPDAFPREMLRFRGNGETHVSDTIRVSGFRTVFDSRASVHHFVPKERMTKAYFAQRAYDQGISDSYADIRVGQCRGVPLRRRIDWLRSLVLSYARIPMVAGDPAEHELLAVQRATLASHRLGYRFHRHEVLADPLLLAWVLKRDYLE
jgi:glucosyl-dolichyl phosphate glucuronosyltransferase